MYIMLYVYSVYIMIELSLYFILFYFAYLLFLSNIYFLEDISYSKLLHKFEDK